MRNKEEDEDEAEEEEAVEDDEVKCEPGLMIPGIWCKMSHRIPERGVVCGRRGREGGRGERGAGGSRA